jgi:PPOX class probable F420-dependent enzyme
VTSPLIDESSAFGGRVAQHLRQDVVVWFTTVTSAGTPQPSPVWFLWDGDREVLVFSKESQRVTNIAGNPPVSLNFRGDRLGGDIVVLTGEAPPARRGSTPIRRRRTRSRATWRSTASTSPT